VERIEPEETRTSPERPAGDTTLREVLAGLAADGWSDQLWVVEAPDDEPTEVACGSCHCRVAPAEVVVDSVRRLEGASDPDDMLAVLAATCPCCGAKGALVLRYGPEAGVHDAEVLVHLADERRPVGEVDT
jgi:hypothetical protein